MTSLLTFALVLLLPAATPEKPETPRKPHPFAPSLPDLTDEEEAHFDQIVDQFILSHIGKLKGEAGQKAVEAFNGLPPEAIFALLRGMNRAATVDSRRTAAVALSKKIGVILRHTADAQLLDFARENVGARENPGARVPPPPRKLTAEEQANFDKIVDDFILFDVGKLRGAPGLKAREAFEQLPPEAIQSLVRGLNRSATLEVSCPVRVIGRRIKGIVGSTRHPEVLDFALANIGTGVKQSRYMSVLDGLHLDCKIRQRELEYDSDRGLPPGVVNDLRTICILRKKEIERGLTATKTDSSTGSRWLAFKPSGKKPREEKSAPAKAPSPGAAKEAK